MERIFGLETEFGIAYTPANGRRLGPEEIARYLFKPVVAWGRSSNVFLGNGSRLYLDVGSHPEYATAECRCLSDLIAQDQAGSKLFIDLLVRAQEAIGADGHDGTAHLLKNNFDAAGNSYGSHENFLIRRSMDFSHLTKTLLPFLVTRQLLAGAGAIIPEKVDVAMPVSQTNRANPNAASTQVLRPTGTQQFGLSARSDVMWEGVSSATTRSRPIINARDEPHADAERFRRLHVIVGDSSMSQATTALKVGSAALVLDLIESGVPLGNMSLRDPIREIRVVARDLAGSHGLELADGRTLTTLELLSFYLEKVTKLVERGDHSLGDDRLAAYVLDLWGRQLAAVGSGDFSQVETEIDWVMKKKVFDRYLERSDMSLDDARMTRLDVAYHDLTPGKGLFATMERSGLATTLVSAEDIDRAKDQPPQDTRAKIRGRFIDAAHGSGREYTVDWVHLRLNDMSTRAVSLRDPFAAEDAAADTLIASIGAA